MTNAPERIWAWEYKGNSPWGPIKPDLDVVTNGAEYIRADLHAETIEADDKWRDLALQFDGHRMQALQMLRWARKHIPEGVVRNDVDAFLNAPPLPGEQVLADRIRALAEQEQKT